MYGEYDAIVVYGVTDSFERVLDEKWLTENYPFINIFAYNIVRLYRCQPVYGIECDFDIKTGVASIGDTYKKQVDDFYEKFKEYHTKNKTNFFENDCIMGYHLCIDGDYSVGNSLDKYTLD